MRSALLLLAFELAGCNAGAGGGPDVRAQAQPALAASWQQYGADLDAARHHRLSYVQAVARFRENASATPGVHFTGPDQVLMAYMAALAVEVDAHRMTPETMAFHVQERLTQNDADQQREVQEQRQIQAANTVRALQSLQAMQQQMQQAAVPQLPPDPPTFQMPPIAAPTTRIQTNCTSTTMGQFTNTSCF